jgi:outer membrane protein TolC
VREQELALEADVTIRLAEVRAAHRSAELEERNQTLADEQLRLAQERYRLGFIPFLDLVDAETLKAEADRDLLNAVYGYHDALAALEAAVGRSLRPN